MKPVKNKFLARKIITAVAAAVYAILPDIFPGPIDDAIVGVIAAVLELIWAIQSVKAEKQNKDNS
ncbi:MAG: hypothetical protein K6B74_03115 [Ruminococcus sp.]|nr:hypothetical protein [Ruminococcus sp.]